MPGLVGGGKGEGVVNMKPGGDATDEQKVEVVLTGDGPRRTEVVLLFFQW